ncbi:MAG: hypothetical protein ACOYXU_10815 [Nitrospirota bacterium]
MSANRGHAPSVISLLRAVSHGLHAALRGGGAVIEGIEFWGTHRHLIPSRIGQFLAAAACTALMARAVAELDGALPSASVLLLPWYLVAVEWAWSQLPSGLSAAVIAWGAETAYLCLVSIPRLVAAVVGRRGGDSGRSVRVSPRGTALACLLVGGLGCAGLAYVPVVGPLAALALSCPVLGAGLVMTTLASRGMDRREILGFARARSAMLSGLGAGVLVAFAIPVVNLVALPCAAAGTACLVLREERAAPVKTSAETVPYASPGK